MAENLSANQLTRDPDLDSAVCASRTGDLAFLNNWLAAGNDPNRYDAEGWTPLLAAASRGQAEVVKLLLNPGIPDAIAADPDQKFLAADALPIYMAGQNGDLETVKVLLKVRPQHLFARSNINGHTVLLQAAFFGKQKHLELARYLLEHLAEILEIKESKEKEIGEKRKMLTVATNIRGYNGLRMNTELWHNEAMAALFRKFDTSTREEQDAYYEELLLSIATPQQLTERLFETLGQTLGKLKAQPGEAEKIEPEAWQQVEKITGTPGFEINRLGGPLQQPILVFAVTGVDTEKTVADFRKKLTRYLLKLGADPDLPEVHPMGVDAVIRTAVLNNLELLQLLAEFMRPETLAAAMNAKPAVNGLTALHDSVHRALTSPPEKLPQHLAQIEWMIARGARYDIEDHAGQTQENLARTALQDPNFRKNAQATLKALGLS